MRWGNAIGKRQTFSEKQLYLKRSSSHGRRLGGGAWAQGCVSRRPCFWSGVLIAMNEKVRWQKGSIRTLSLTALDFAFLLRKSLGGLP